MKPFVLTLRAIGSRLALRLYIPAVIAAAVVLALLVGGGVWLTTLSSWWWLLFIPITALFCIALAVALVVLFLIRYVQPSQTKAQKKAVSNFVDKLQSVADVAGTPKFIILFRVVRSIAAPSKDSYLADLANTGKLAKDFRDLQGLFRKQNRL